MGEGLVSFTRGIARAAKQSGWLTLASVNVPLGCFGALRLAMTKVFLMLSPSEHEETTLSQQGSPNRLSN